MHQSKSSDLSTSSSSSSRWGEHLQRRRSRRAPRALIDAGTVRLIDLLILIKDDDGNLDAVELSDLDDLGPFERLEAELAEFLAEDDVTHLAAAMEPGSVAGVIVYENRWAAPFAAAARRAGGQLIADGRIPAEAILAALEADEALESQGA